jgi:hypothetical protein
VGGLKFLFDALQRLGHPVQRDFQGCRQAVLLEVAQLIGTFVPPLLSGAREEVTRRVTSSRAAVLDDVDLFAR